MKSQKFCVKTVGCKVNQYESQLIREQLVGAGLSESSADAKSDICVINTCTVTQTADRKSRDLIRQLIRKNPNAKIIASGCYVERDRAAIAAIPGVDLVLDNRQKSRIIDFVIPNSYGKMPVSSIQGFSGHTRAFLKIQDGCDNYCSFCKVRLARGASISRGRSVILEEARNLIANGFKEIVLCGICLGSWGRDLEPAVHLSGLIEVLDKLSGEFRLRLSSIEPQDADSRLIKQILNSKHFCRHLHIPLQSGSEAILKAMKRKYNTDYYKELADTLRKTIPDIAITTDIIVGFPGETDANFQETIKFLNYLKPSRMHIFGYSARPGTEAAVLKDKIPVSIIKQRETHLKDLAQKYSYEFRKNFIGKTLSALAESKNKLPGFLNGYSDNYIEIQFPGPQTAINQFVNVKVERLEGNLTFGRSLNNCLTVAAC